MRIRVTGDIYGNTGIIEKGTELDVDMTPEELDAAGWAERYAVVSGDDKKDKQAVTNKTKDEKWS